MKKFGVLLLAIGLVLCVVAVAKEVVLRVATWDTAEGLHWTEVAMQKFMAEHPDIKIKLESIPQGYDDRILTSLAGGNPPDVFLWWNLPVLAERGGIEPLDQYDINFDNIAPALNAWATYDGRIYGITKDYSCEVIWYNKKIFDKYGVPYPTDDWTWEDFRRIAIQLTHPEEMIYGTVFLE
ncbi:MAG: extracellular solute-binding protein, partial [Clostridia bacterium]|nr:extracellular solute-binding protein [Clostridia bacterium]